MKQPPEGWKLVALGDLLTPDQLKEITPILYSTDDFSSKVSSLKAALSPLREQLEAKGVVPEYLAYYLAFQFAGSKIP